MVFNFWVLAILIAVIYVASPSMRSVVQQLARIASALERLVVLANRAEINGLFKPRE